jgi:hypothetical protein
MAFKKGKWVTHGIFRDKKPLDIRKKGMLNQENPRHPEKFRNIHTLFRLPFTYKGGGAKLRYSADDIARIYVNGRFIDMGPAPAYHFSFGYMEIDITPFVKEGFNIIGSHLYYQGELNRTWPSGDFRTGFIAEVETGGEVTAYTDSPMRCRMTRAYGRGETIGYRTQYLEHFDANEWEYGWNLPGFDESNWEDAARKENNDHVFHIQASKNLEFYEVRPVDTKMQEDGTMLYDLGCEYAGTVRFNARGAKGDIVEIRCAEELEENGRARYDMRCNCLYRQTFTLSGEGWEGPDFFDYMAFRYIEIMADPETGIRDVHVLARNYPFDYGSTGFKSDNKRMEGIWTIFKNGVRTGTQEGFLDCPTREKGLYLGDMTVTGRSHFYLTGDLSAMKRALKGFAQSTYYAPGMQTTCLNHYINTLVDYSFQYPLNLLFYYENSGDREFINEMLPYCESMMDYYRSFEKGGLLYDVTDELHLVDWPRSPYDFTDGYDYDLTHFKTTGTHNVLNAFYIMGLKCMDEIYGILETAPPEGTKGTVDAYIDKFYDPHRKLFTDTPESSHASLHSNVLPLYLGIAPEGSVPEIINMIRQKGMNCGVYMAFFLLKALFGNGRHELAMDLILSDARFSWGTMLKQGATTCFEVWDKGYKWNTSLCHPWASAPIALLVEDVMGIAPKEPGWKSGYEISPQNVERLGDFNLTVHANGYRIGVERSNGAMSHRRRDV